MRWQPGLSVAQPHVEAAPWAAVAPLVSRVVPRLGAALRGAMPHPFVPAVALLPPLAVYQPRAPAPPERRCRPGAWLRWPQPRPARQSPRDCQA